MTPSTFGEPWTLDTNVLVYATELTAAPAKQRVARSLFSKLGEGGNARLLGQVMGEFMAVSLRKKVATAGGMCDLLESLCKAVTVLGATPACYESAFTLVAKHQYQVWDALIIAVCAEHGVKTLYSEDVGSLKRPLGVHVVNPFAGLVTS